MAHLRAGDGSRRAKKPLNSDPQRPIKGQRAQRPTLRLLPFFYFYEHRRSSPCRRCQRGLRPSRQGRRLSHGADLRHARPRQRRKAPDERRHTGDGRADDVIGQRDQFIKSQEVDLAYSVGGLGRFRVNVFQQRGTWAWCFASSLRDSDDRRPAVPAGASPHRRRRAGLVSSPAPPAAARAPRSQR